MTRNADVSVEGGRKLQPPQSTSLWIAGRWSLPALLVLAFAVRATDFFAFPSLHCPDEVFETLEPAHRIAFGYGIKSWEFVDGIRSMVFPYFLAGLFRLSSTVFGGPEGYITFSRLTLALLSCLPVAAIWRMGKRESPAHALIAGVVAATWFEQAFFSFRTLNEAVACDFALTALALASRPAAAFTGRALAAIGACLATSVMLRLQLAPGAVFVWLVVGQARFADRWRPLAMGAAPVVALFGAVDWLTWGAPFISYLRYMDFNLGVGGASKFGEEPWNWYPTFLAALWFPFAPLIAGLGLGALLRRRWLLWAAYAAIEIGVHSLIPHKEYRFIYPATAALIIAAALVSADLLRTAPYWRRAAVAAAWVSASAGLALSPGFDSLWRHEREVIAAEYWLAHRADLCGVMFYNGNWYGGYAYLHRDAPIYSPAYVAGLADRGPTDFAEAGRSAARSANGAYNYVVLDKRDLAAFPGWRTGGCFYGLTCVVMRTGGCRGDSTLVPVASVPRIGEPRVLAAGR